MSRTTRKRLEGIAWALNAPLALVMEPRQTGLSLGRCAMLALTAALVWLIFCHPHVFVRMSAPAACVVVALYCILAAYNWGAKPAVQDAISAIARSLPGIGGAVSSLTAAPASDASTATETTPC